MRGSAIAPVVACGLCAALLAHASAPAAAEPSPRAAPPSPDYPSPGPPPPPPPWLHEQLPAELDYEDGDLVPAGYVQDTRMRKGLVIAGALTLGSTWIASVVYASMRVSGGEAKSAVMYLPVAGPALGAVDQSDDNVVPILAADSLAQGTGLILLVVGLAAPQTYLRRVDEGELIVTPMLGQGGTGACLSTRF